MKIFKSIFNKKEEISDFYLSDCQRIVLTCYKKDYIISLEEAFELWHQYSEQHYAAGWLMMPEEDEQLWKILETLKVN